MSVKEFEWKRLNEVFTGEHDSLWGQSGITPNDIDQGALGNCWFLSAAAALAERPDRIERLFLNEQRELNEAGIYAVNFYALGVPHTVVVDDWLPIKSDGKTLFSRVTPDGAMWPVILEKAFAKYYGNYRHIAGGNPGSSA